MTARQKKQHNLLSSPSLKNWGKPLYEENTSSSLKDVIVNCGWGRLVFGHTFSKNTTIADILKDERPGQRDLAIYLRDPHVVLAKAPQQLFLDPSHTYRLWLDNIEKYNSSYPFEIRELKSKSEIEAVNTIYQQRNMVTIDNEALSKENTITYLIAIDKNTKDIIGVMMGVDHVKAFNDPENGASLWALAVDSRTLHSGVGISLVKYFANYYKKLGRSFIDVSVLHSNDSAIALYEKIGFERVPVFCIKNKNAINENLFIAPEHNENFNQYAAIIVNEARRRGIEVEVIDSKEGFFNLKYGGRSIVCRESLTDQTSAIAMTRCAEKDTTLKLLKNAGLNIPKQITANETDAESLKEFLKNHKKLVVKPANGEQGAGITLPIENYKDLEKAIKKAGGLTNKVIIEEMVEGDDLRIVVIGFQVVAAAIRKPPEIVGNGENSIEELIKKLSRRRQAATDNESSIPINSDTRRCIESQGYKMADILPEEKRIFARKTANLHTGGTIHDVTNKLHPKLIEAAKLAAHAIDIPVVGLDFIVKKPSLPEYVIIEANERPGLANHDPQPTAERFIDLLFPNSIAPTINNK